MKKFSEPANLRSPLSEVEYNGWLMIDDNNNLLWEGRTSIWSKEKIYLDAGSRTESKYYDTVFGINRRITVFSKPDGSTIGLIMGPDTTKFFLDWLKENGK